MTPNRLPAAKVGNAAKMDKGSILQSLSGLFSAEEQEFTDTSAILPTGESDPPSVRALKADDIGHAVKTRGAAFGPECRPHSALGENPAVGGDMGKLDPLAVAC